MPEHNAPPAPHASDTRRLGLALAITAGFMVIEVAGGLYSGSLALLADAGHMLTDTAALSLAWGAAHVARRAATASPSHGHHRAQVLAAFVNAVALLGVVGWIAWEAVERMLAPRPVAGGPMLGIALLGLAANLAVLQVLRAEHDANLNVAAARLHVLGDLLGSVAASIAAIVILATDWTPIDPLLSLIVALLIARSAWALLLRSTRLILRHEPDGEADPSGKHGGAGCREAGR